jgi:alginate O-acetyltransferase complex protein AlgI
MLFPTIEFAIFFAVVFAFTWTLNEWNSVKKWFLVAASYLFYAAWSPTLVLILLASSTANFTLALLLDHLPNERLRLMTLWLGVIGNLALLGAFKYYNFFAAEIANALGHVGLQISPSFLELALPIAISFITFHALSYIIDVYRRRLVATRSLVDILLYISFFPHLVAGPIVRARDFLAQTTQKRDPANIRLGESVTLIVGGLFKKVVIANYLSVDFVDAVFRDPGSHTSLDLLLGVYAYALQIYCDFSAYTDIAIGVANLLGYEFPQNFNQPYRALSIADFWHRWHMTLSSWLRDYLYIPLGGNRHGALKTYRNLLLTMTLGGLWHGASWNFVIWGAGHGAALAVERALALDASRSRGHTARFIGWLVTFHLVCLGWIFFRAPSLETAILYLDTLVSGDKTPSTTMTPLAGALLALGALTQMVPARWFDTLAQAYESASIPAKVAFPFAAIFIVCVAAPGGVPPFIYFQF